MPRLAKGAKWTYGWIVVSAERMITIPPDAWCEFGFRVGDEALFTPGSLRSGGFALSTPALMAQRSQRHGRAMLRILCRGEFGDGRVVLPTEIGAKPGDRLLAVRGSRHGLGFVAQGPIYEEALKHSHMLQLF
jgi:hypothetical protein